MSSISRKNFRKFIKEFSIFSSNSEFRDFNFREMFSIEKDQFNDSSSDVDSIMKAKDSLSIKSKERSSRVKNKRFKKKNDFERSIRRLKFRFEHIEKNMQTRRNERDRDEKDRNDRNSERNKDERNKNERDKNERNESMFSNMIHSFQIK